MERVAKEVPSLDHVGFTNLDLRLSTFVFRKHGFEFVTQLDRH